MTFFKGHPLVFPGAASMAQAKAGNYRKRKVAWRGLTISIENEAGTIRRGKGWETRMVFPYGEILRTTGVDGDPVDIILGPNLDAPMVYVVHQRRYGDWEAYDEDKCCVGFLSEDEARNAFLANYNDPRFLGPITPMPADEFVKKAKATKEAPAMIKSIIFLKSVVGPYNRSGHTVQGYDNHKTAATKEGVIAKVGKYEIHFSAARKKRGMDPFCVFEEGNPRGLHQCSSEADARKFIGDRGE